MWTRPSKIISGGQTGTDVGALWGAECCGIPTGGWAPKGYRTELKGARAAHAKAVLRDRFGLLEHDDWRYDGRTRSNIVISNMTLIISDDYESRGTILTRDICRELGKPCLMITSETSALPIASEQIAKHSPATLNVAGNRESVSPGITRRVKEIMEELFNAS